MDKYIDGASSGPEVSLVLIFQCFFLVTVWSVCCLGLRALLVAKTWFPARTMFWLCGLLFLSCLGFNPMFLTCFFVVFVLLFIISAMPFCSLGSRFWLVRLVYCFVVVFFLYCVVVVVVVVVVVILIVVVLFCRSFCCHHHCCSHGFATVILLLVPLCSLGLAGDFIVIIVSVLVYVVVLVVCVSFRHSSSSLKFCWYSLFVTRHRVEEIRKWKRERGDKDMMQGGHQKMLKKWESLPTFLLVARGPQKCLGSATFEAQVRNWWRTTCWGYRRNTDFYSGVATCSCSTGSFWHFQTHGELAHHPRLPS